VKGAQYIAALILLVAWLPATSHCLLGAAGMMPDTCCSEHGQESEPPPADRDDDCATCSNVESGLYKISAQNNPAFSFQATLTADLIQSVPLTISPIALQRLSSRAPPGLTVRWQFITRAALPGRAPAIL
jgi:hypothetical protein